MKKRKFREKQTLSSALLAEQMQYPQLYYIDSLYPECLHLLKSNQFRAFIRRTARHLNSLLSLNTVQFFTILENNLTIRTSLESCLASFPRRKYGRLFDSRASTKNVSSIKDESLKEYSFLMKLVLFIFYRISSAQQQEDKQLVYNQFLLDIPKLLDIAAIYGQSNPDIVRKLIANAYQIHSSYDADTMDFFNHIEHGKFQEMQRNQQSEIDFSPQSLKAENFGNCEKYMIQKVLLNLFTVKDILFNLTNFILYFPRKYVFELASDFKLQGRLIDGVTFFMNQVNNQWVLGDYKEIYFSLHLEDLRQSIVIYFIEEFKMLRQMSQKGKEFELIEQTHLTYQTFCQLLKTTSKPNYKEFVKIINNLIQQTEQTVFFLQANQLSKAGGKTKEAVEYCQKYEQQYRRSHKLARTVDFDPILNKNRDNLKKFKQIWVSSSELKRKAIAKENEQKFKKIEDHQLNGYLNNLKYGGKSKEYDDEPQQQQYIPVALPNQYQKVDNKDQLNLSFSKPKRYVLKESVISASQSNLSADLSFVTSIKKDILQDLSLMESKQASQHFQNQSQSLNENQDISFILPKQDLFDELDISKIQPDLGLFNSVLQKQFEQFIWSDDYQGDTVRQVQDFIQKIDNKNDISQNLSFV